MSPGNGVLAASAAFSLATLVWGLLIAWRRRKLATIA